LDPVNHTRNNGFDYLKVGIYFMVAFAHQMIMGARNVFPYFDAATYQQFTPSGYQVLVLSGIFLSLPIYFQISLFLYAQKVSPGDYGRLKKRLSYLARLAIFWMIVCVAFQVVFQNQPFKPMVANAASIFRLIAAGGGLHMYFLFALIYLTALTHFYVLFIDRIKPAGKLITMLLFYFLALLLTFFQPFYIAKDLHTLPFQYLGYVTAVPLIQACLKDVTLHRKALIVSGIGFLIFTVLDWLLIPFYGKTGYLFIMIPLYARLSLVLGALFFVLLACYYPLPENKTIRVLVGYTLGVICLHLLLPYDQQLQDVFLKQLGLPLLLTELIMTGIRIAYALTLTWLFKKQQFLRQFVA
jgi:hypothetical protein